MTIIEKIRAFINRLAPAAVCEICVTERLDLQRTYVGKVMRELAGEAGFEARIDLCSLCCGEKRVLRGK
jgi:hypothetical protein